MSALTPLSQLLRRVTLVTGIIVAANSFALAIGNSDAVAIVARAQIRVAAPILVAAAGAWAVVRLKPSLNKAVKRRYLLVLAGIGIILGLLGGLGLVLAPILSR